MMKNKFGFIGAGALTGAMVECLTVYSGGVNNVEFCLYDKFTAQYEKFEGKRFVAENSIRELVDECEYIVLAVKPQNLSEVLDEIKNTCQDISGRTFVTPAAGIAMSTITDVIGNVPVIRIMPNMPLRIGYGVTALCRNGFASEEQYHMIYSLFSACGYAFELPESAMNPVIAATSSSPAYVYMFIKAMIDGCERLGLDHRTMLEPVCRTVIGSAYMLLQSKCEPQELIDMVATKGGTTEQAVSVLEGRDFACAVADAMAACSKRADELSKI